MTRVLLFDLNAGGHHAEYIRHLVTCPGAAGLEFGVAGPPELHAQIGDLDPATATTQVRRLVTRSADGLPGGRAGLLASAVLNGWELRRQLARFRPHIALAMCFDHLQPAFAAGLPLPAGSRVAGILFRPDFAWASVNDVPTRTDRIESPRKRILLRRALGHPGLTRIFCPDRTAVPHLDALAGRPIALPLPDPVDAGAFRRGEDHGPGDRLSCLMFGELDERKGLLALLDALVLCPPATLRQLRIVLAGRVAASVRPALDRFRAAPPAGLELVVRDERVPEEALPQLFAAADLVLMIYQASHLGSSGVLIKAAAVPRPVLATGAGLIAHNVRTHGLGITVDAASPPSIAAALDEIVRQRSVAGFRAPAAQAFAADNSVGAFTHLLLATLRTDAAADYLPPRHG